MQWFKHYNNASKKEVFVRLSNEFGRVRAVGLYWIFIEYFHSIWDSNKEPKFIVNKKELRTLLELKDQKLLTFLTSMQDVGTISFVSFENKIEIFLHKLPEILTKDQKYNRKRIAKGSQTAMTDKDKDKDKENKPPIVPQGGSRSFVSDDFSQPNRKKPKMSPEDVMRVYNDSAPPLPRIKLLNAARRRRVAKLIKDFPDAFTEQSLGEMIQQIKLSDFHIGKNDRGWVANFDWFIREENFIKLFEGSFNGRPSVPLRIFGSSE